MKNVPNPTRRPPERHTTQITNAVAPPLPGAAKAAPPDAEAATGVLCRGFGAGAGAPLLRSQSCGCCRWYLILCRRPNLFAAPPHRRGCRGWGAGIQSSWSQPSLCGGRVWPRPSLRGGRGRTRQAGSGAFHPPTPLMCWVPVAVPPGFLVSEWGSSVLEIRVLATTCSMFLVAATIEQWGSKIWTIWES
jgi:hypothetical protein